MAQYVDIHCHGPGRFDNQVIRIGDQIIPANQRVLWSGSLDRGVGPVDGSGVASRIGVYNPVAQAFMGVKCATLPYAIGRHPWQSAQVWQGEDVGSVQGVDNLTDDARVLRFGFTDRELQGAWAIGEVGLDYTPSALAKSPKERQFLVFTEQVALSGRLGKPLVIHSVKAQRDTLDVLRNTEVAWIWHGFGRGAENARQILAVSPHSFLSFGARLLSDIGLQQVFATLPVERIFLETDTASDQVDISQIYQVAAELQEISVEQLQYIILQNLIKWLGKRGLPYYLAPKI